MITYLTPEQEAQLSVYADEGIKVGLDTTTVDVERVKELIPLMYMSAGYKPPKEIRVFPGKSPLFLSQEATKILGEPQYPSNMIYGSHDVAWLWKYKFYEEQLNIEFDKIVDSETGKTLDISIVRPWIDFAYVGGWAVLMNELALVCDKPCECHLKNGVRHKDGGPFLRYADGFQLFALNGVDVPEWLATTPAADLKASDINRLANEEQKREFIIKFTWDRWALESGAKVIHTLDEYELIETAVSDMTQRFLKMINPSIGCVHVEGVPNSVNTVEEALAFRTNDPTLGKTFKFDDKTGADWFQQGDKIIIPYAAYESGVLKLRPKILT